MLALPYAEILGISQNAVNKRGPEIIPEEAEVVRSIFAAALQSQGHTDITRWLNESGIERGHGRERWHCSTEGFLGALPARSSAIAALRPKPVVLLLWSRKAI